MVFRGCKIKADKKDVPAYREWTITQLLLNLTSWDICRNTSLLHAVPTIKRVECNLFWTFYYCLVLRAGGEMWRMSQILHFYVTSLAWRTSHCGMIYLKYIMVINQSRDGWMGEMWIWKKTRQQQELSSVSSTELTSDQHYSTEMRKCSPLCWHVRHESREVHLFSGWSWFCDIFLLCSHFLLFQPKKLIFLKSSTYKSQPLNTMENANFL